MAGTGTAVGAVLDSKYSVQGKTIPATAFVSFLRLVRSCKKETAARDRDKGGRKGQWEN